MLKRKSVKWHPTAAQRLRHFNLVKTAREIYGTEDCEIDNTASISETDDPKDGVWVQAWVHVPATDTGA